MAAPAEDAVTSQAALRRANRRRAPPTPDRAMSRAAVSARSRMRLASPADDAFTARCRETHRFRLRGALQVMENPGRSGQSQNGIPTIKRSRRVVLTMMGSAAVGVVSMGLVPRVDCGPGNTVVPGPDGKPY